LLKAVSGLQKVPIVWEDVVDNNVKVSQDTIVNIFKGGSSWQGEMEKVTGQYGLKVILSSCWYLDIISYAADWIKVQKVYIHS